MRPRQIGDIQYDTTIMGGREVSRPYRVWFSPKSCFIISTNIDVSLSDESDRSDESD